MSEHKQTQQLKEPKPAFQKQTASIIQTPISNPASIVQRARMSPKSLSHADVLQLQRTIGNRAVGRLLSEIRNTSKVQQAPIQRQKLEQEETCPSCMQRQEIPEEEEPLQGKMVEPIQRQEIPEEEEPLQKKSENNTGMPDNLKAGVESLSGIDMSDVRVHYNSSKPAEVGALAYTQGTNIHVAPGQERHLPHEAWHVVQQAQGRVRPTMQLKNVAVNDDAGLEQEADLVGTNALQMYAQRKTIQKNHRADKSGSIKTCVPIIQRTFLDKNGEIIEGNKQITWNKDEAIDLLKRLAKGDVSVRQDLGITYQTYWESLMHPPPPSNSTALNGLQSREYAVITKNDTEYHLIVGSEAGVTSPPQYVQIAHSHPLFRGTERREYDKPFFLDDIQKMPFGHPYHLPSAGDIRYCAREKVREHAVITPYSVIKETGEVIKQATNPQAPQLLWIITEANIDSERNATAKLKAMANNLELKLWKISVPEYSRDTSTSYTITN